MKYIVFLLILWAGLVESKTIITPPPDGLTHFGLFDANAEFEKKAFDAAKEYLKSKNEDLNNYYLAENKLDIKTGLYRFHIKHISTYRRSKAVFDESYKNGVMYYDGKRDEIVKFHRK
ncbi:hypothetical protein PC2016_3742 [Pseudoalteromonas carrageenovora]|uniref:Uncharacterized protein n=1 Tax=Pseudoalteromonas carrageenovora IAM 12662 TaxID=1314868 RepID=A0A2K4XE83_PSEVC|nr:hypothetical protein [Pseudoalteromonas carrageenovora]MDO6835242.1 hypothetical protein [Pseudoalteromonas carrageenovora]QBJ73910.1 hypothetical protein PC2016_3742 [Pseudoalteromonas carrageenovora]GEB72036.1 hypothetical protein PCA01_27460 [Pseudoalteromonas carrageenovora]SOU42630.1 conserved protein of unknown function [Pseudoalteromonas carrageenovora IAM 12662]